MAEAALFSIASKVLSTIASPAFEVAYERARSIWGARNELQELRETITTIHAVLLDAEKKQNDSAAVKNWIERVSDVLYDAEDLFDVVATADILKQRKIKGKKHLKEVRVFFSKLNPIASSDFIAKKVKAIRKDLRKISDDVAMLNFVSRVDDEKSVTGLKRVEIGSFVDPKNVIGREDEKEQVLSFLFDESYAERNISLISIVGIGGMGKSTLAQLVYNDQKIRNGFQQRFWACISDISIKKEVLGTIYQSMAGGGQYQYQGKSVDQLESGIRESVGSKGKFLLVLDDLWDDIDKAIGCSELLSLLSSDDAKGSKIIVTTRQSSVARAMKSDKTLELRGLSSDASWELFRRIAFTEEQENVPTWISLGKKILEKCVSVPLAIKIVGGLLRGKDTIEEWRSFENLEISKIEHAENPIMSTLRLSYDHLPSHLKNCFAYCSLFPKDYELCKQDLIYLWIAQGYVKPKNEETLEMAGHAYFMELFRRSYFQEATYMGGGIRYCKMHDLIHDLAQHVAGERSIILTEGMNQSHKKIRHVTVAHKIDKAWSIPLSLLEPERIRSTLFMYPFVCSTGVLDQHVTKYIFLRVLHLGLNDIEEVPFSLGGLKYLRYLNLSGNRFSHLPDSITKLVNLITLDISECEVLVELPKDIGELINLRHLKNLLCFKLVAMPVSFGELTSLQHLGEFRVSNGSGVDGKYCGFDALARINLQGDLPIIYDEYGEWSEDDLTLMYGHIEIPNTLELLVIQHYPSTRIPAWWREGLASRLPKLECLTLVASEHVKHLAPLRCLPCLRSLSLMDLPQLEYIEDEVFDSTAPFFPSLQKLDLSYLGSLLGWSSVVINPKQQSFPLLSELEVSNCPNLSSIPLAPHLKSVHLSETSTELEEHLKSTYSFADISIEDVEFEKQLQYARIWSDDDNSSSKRYDVLASMAV